MLIMELNGRKLEQILTVDATDCNVLIYYPPVTLLNEYHREKLFYAKENNGETPSKNILDNRITNFDEIQKVFGIRA